MSDNNFKKVETDIQERHGAPSRHIENGIAHTTGFFTFAGNILEIFLPKVVELFVAMSGGSPDNKKYSNKTRTPDRGGNQGPRMAP